MFFAPIIANVGIDPVKDIHWVVEPLVQPVRLFAKGKVDAFFGFPPEGYEQRLQKVGPLLFRSVVERLWAHHFWRMLAANCGFVSKDPNATKRATRAVLKAIDLCVSDPELAARQMVDGGFSSHRP